LSDLFLDRIDSAPVINSGIEMQLMQWIGLLVDTLNEDIDEIEGLFNLLSASSYTSTQITNMQTAGTLTDGMLLYDSTLNEYVGRISGALVKFTTTPYP
jgi:class 3 adenylate cyclase